MVTKDFKPLAISVVLVSVLCIVIVLWKGTIAEASVPKPSKAVLQHFENIKRNQAGIQQRKEWNRLESDLISKEGWSIDWKKMTLVPSFQ